MKYLSKKHQFIRRIEERFFLRFHMSLILTATALSGLLATKVLLFFNVKEMLVRYPLAVVFSYLVFFILIKIWLWYVSSSASGRESSTVENVIDTVGNSIDIPINLPYGSSDSFGFGGGSSGGGGASASFDMVDAPSKMISSAGDAVGEAASGIFDDEGGIVLIVLGVLLAAIFGAGLYLVYSAPAILSEAAFEAMMATNLIRATKRIDDPDWMGSVFRSTVWPFIIILVLAFLLAWTVESYFPNATKLADVWN